MDEFIVSARKYRPETFDNVVGQDSVTNTLQNAISNHHLAQAYLFCGPRGVGKTTCARIFAKVINMEDGNFDDPNADFSFNIFELDAASNNSVEDIRSLIDQVRVPPQIGKYKVYIIDEVHMLSQAAFNAFLKTLEEPPAHAIFILATTEKHKIIPTILSRCQIFDFNRIQITDIANHLQKIATNEGITADPDALHIIAQKADGALRDALSIFDQLVSFAGNNITYQAVIDNLNILDYDYYFKLTDHILAGNIPAALLVFDNILNNGFDGHNFVNGLGSHLRNLLVCKDEATLKLLEVGETIKAKYSSQSEQCPMRLLISGLKMLSKADVQYKSSKNQRLLVEIVLMQLCSITDSDHAEKKNDIPFIKPAKPAPPAAQKLSTEGIKAKEAQIANASQPAESPAVIEKKEPVVAMDTPVIEETEAAPKREEITIEHSKPTVQQVQRFSTGSTAKTNTFSITKALNPTVENEVNEEDETKNYGNMPKTPFTQAELNIAWKQYALRLKANGKDSFYSTLTKKDPVLRDDYTIEMTLLNAVQERDLDREKVDLLDFLRSELNNFSIQLEAEIQEIQEDKSLYTSSEKFKHMAQKNPSLLKLKEQLNLDVDI
jgi:DNA polymerase-3 subunit gamma/tau